MSPSASRSLLVVVAVAVAIVVLGVAAVVQRPASANAPSAAASLEIPHLGVAAGIVSFRLNRSGSGRGAVGAIAVPGLVSDITGFSIDPKTHAVTVVKRPDRYSGVLTGMFARRTRISLLTISLFGPGTRNIVGTIKVAPARVIGFDHRNAAAGSLEELTFAP